MSWLIAVISSLLASQARFSFPMRSIIASRMPSMSEASVATSSTPSTVIGPSRSPAPTVAASCDRRMIRQVSRLVYQKSTLTSTRIPTTRPMIRLSVSSLSRELSVMEI